MRALFCSTDGVSHLFPLVPLAWAMRAAGHEVLVTFAEHTDQAVASGLHIVDVAPGFDGMAIFNKTLEDNPEFAQMWWNETLGDDPSRFALMPAELNRPFFERTFALVEQWRPDVVVYEQTAAYGLIVASKLGVPAVQRNLGIVRTGGLHRAIAALLPDVFERYGVPALADPALVLETVPPSMFPFERPEGEFVRDVVFTGGAVLGDRLPERGDRPRIAVTLGTNRPGTDGLGPLKGLLASSSALDAELVLALGETDLTPLGELPANVRAVGWTPLEPLFRTCDGVVHHGGGTTTMAAIDAGIPQVVGVNPLYPGNETLAPAVRKAGIGIVADEQSIDGDVLNQMLHDESLRANTAAVQEELASLPGPAELVRRLEDLAR
ncbi:nucleotide disphospho-sugar-binding domain-containing protein [Goodfellowiella coeruleoviolacea]|uniref:UDP:flavonoid glycosyltransferase YjiC, YdhE family n=1 Tax=Goodfellowiella coeruleoviolacea TaxID=334858 RepID=A0AAE3GHB1_9PSEU|nr:nucleotide disphospho-sugar-binding domain-containing protein [Goodfellowiella coeruleoviolacea]MCP2167718.1 UDP:flavonoid glycosyltransferase YjiC, YdhE family [Goodfellowiella coeruleoviolacea]